MLGDALAWARLRRCAGAAAGCACVDACFAWADSRGDRHSARLRPGIGWKSTREAGRGKRDDGRWEMREMKAIKKARVERVAVAPFLGSWSSPSWALRGPKAGFAAT